MVHNREKYLITRWKIPHILAAVGGGFVVEEKRAWGDLWNEQIVAVSRIGMQDPYTITVLLTGRNTNFSGLIKRMIIAKKLPFDLIVLKPILSKLPCLGFKKQFLDSLLPPCSAIEEVEIYEDRKIHRDAFHDYLQEHPAASQSGKRLKNFKVHLVQTPIVHLESKVELSLITRLSRTGHMQSKPFKPTLPSLLPTSSDFLDLRSLVDDTDPIRTTAELFPTQRFKLGLFELPEFEDLLEP